MVVEEYKKEVERYLKGLSEYVVNVSDKIQQLRICSIEEWDIFEKYMDNCVHVSPVMLFRTKNLYAFKSFLNKYLGYKVTWDNHNGIVRGFLVSTDVKVLIEEDSIEREIPYFSLVDNIDFYQEKEDIIKPISIKTIKYEMSVEETKAYRAFEKKHRDCKGLISYIITPGPIGDDISVQCTGCGEKKDICDYNW